MGLGHEAPDDRAGPAEPALEPRLRLRCLDLWSPLKGAGRGRRPYAGVPGAGRRHIALRPTGCARARRHPIIARRGRPLTVVSDNGTEFTSMAILRWTQDRQIDWHYIARFRAECLNAHWFLTLADAAEKLEAWRRYYNEDRPHGAIGHKAPISLTNHGGITSPPT